MFSALVLSIAVTAQCESGVCRTPVRNIAAKTKTVIAERQPARKIVRERQPVRRVIDRVMFWR